MRYAIFSDVHGNLQALESVAKRMDQLKVDRRICLGDVVGYGGNPNECVERVAQIADLTIAGNHDHAVLGTTDVGYFNSNAQAAVFWTREILRERSREFLGDLPLVAGEGYLFFVHGSPREPERWHYVLSTPEADLNFEYFDTDLCLIGHSHRPFLATKRGEDQCTVRALNEDRILIEEGSRYIVNEGSVGQPRDGDPRACFLILDAEERSAKIERVPYDIAGAQRAILEAGLPPALADRLRYGS